MKSPRLLMVKMSAYQRLSRTAMFRRKGSSRPENITHSSDSVDHGLVFIQLAAQAMHEHVHDVGLGIKAVVKNVFKDHGLGDRSIGVPHEIFEQSELAWLQLDLLSSAFDL